MVTKKPRLLITVEMKKEIIAKHDSGVRVSNLAKQYKFAKSTISTILKNGETIMAADVAKGVTVLTKQRSNVLEEVERLLLVWINEKQLVGDSISEVIICEKAKRLHSDLLKKTPSTNSVGEEFKASSGWFQKFRRRSGIHSVIRHGEAASSDDRAAEAFVEEFANFVESEEYIPQQVFNCDETGLFWKKMPKRTYITQEEKSLPGHKVMKDRLTVLICANASGDCKMKPLLVYHSENPRVFKRNNVVRAKLPVMWRTNSKAWVTRIIFTEWLTEVFAPNVKKYLTDNDLPMKCLLLMDNAPGHPPDLEERLDSEYDFIKVKFLPPNTTPILQPMDQQVISNFKKLYTKALFSTCFQVTNNDTNLTLKEFWKDHFNILHCINLIDTAWNDVTNRTLQSAWKKLWPSCVRERDFEGFDEQAAVVDEIVSMGKSMGLEMDNADVQELVDDHRDELTTEELVALHNEQIKALKEEHSSEDEDVREEVSSAQIKDICGKWSEVQEFIEKHHPNKFVVTRAINILNDNAISHFRKILQKRQRQHSVDRYFVRTSEKAPKKVQRRETLPPNISPPPPQLLHPIRLRQQIATTKISEYEMQNQEDFNSDIVKNEPKEELKAEFLGEEFYSEEQETNSDNFSFGETTFKGAECSVAAEIEYVGTKNKIGEEGNLVTERHESKSEERGLFVIQGIKIEEEEISVDYAKSGSQQ